MRPDPQAYADVLVLAIKSALGPVQATQAALQTQFASLEARLGDLGALRERIATLEARPIPVGEKGEKGDPGEDGKDGVPGLTYQGVFQDGKCYDVGDVTTWAGSTWHCNEATESKPGDGSKHWTLMVKRGRDGRDGVTK